MRKTLKYLGLGVLGFVALILVSAIVINKRLPEPTYSVEADELASQMLNQLNYDAWKELKYIQWTFVGKHHYVWDKKNNLANIQWKDFKVILDLNTLEGVAFKNNNPTSGKDKQKLIKQAWEHWCNDSFWLIAPYKVMDPGTKRGIIDQKNNKKGLMVSYTDGGVTPGDSYLWILNEQNQPVEWKMWVQKLPIGGVKTTWDNWVELPGGAKVATLRQTAIIKLEISNLNAGQTLHDLNISESTFNFQL